MIEAIFQIVFEIFGELIIEVIGSLIADVSTRGVEKTVRRERPDGYVEKSYATGKPHVRRSGPLDPMLVACGYVAFGWLAGMLSLWLFPQLYIRDYWLRVAGLLLVPVASGLVMSWIGSWRARHDKDVSSIETFAYGFCFAFTMALVRFIWGHAG